MIQLLHNTYKYLDLDYIRAGLQKTVKKKETGVIYNNYINPVMYSPEYVACVVKVIKPCQFVHYM